MNGILTSLSIRNLSLNGALLISGAADCVLLISGAADSVLLISGGDVMFPHALCCDLLGAEDINPLPHLSLGALLL